MFDAHTGDTLLQVSIYKISYCSADAAHADVFAFVGTECGPGIDPLDEQLTCYAFLCGKRKIAQKLALTVAHSFKQAYQIWQEASTRKQFQLERRAARKQQQLQQKPAEAKTATAAAPAAVTALERAVGRRSISSHSCSDADDHQDLLIDISDSDLFDKERHQRVLQNTWVSFDDESESDVHSGATSPVATTTVWDTTLRI